MPKVVPSTVVAAIDQAFPAVKQQSNFPVYSKSAGVLSAIVRLADEIPSELLTISPQDYIDLVQGLEALAHAVDFWKQRGGDDPPPTIGAKSPIFVVRSVLAKCSDQSPAPTTSDLAFITDADLRNSIRLDISSANSALYNSEWKAATVLAGAAVEALLLWAIQSPTAATALAALANKPSGPPDRWVLAEYIAVAERLKLIETNTATQAGLARDFRNLIHPGRAQRTAQICDRGTALSALAAVELVVRDLT
jgi:hypothetical protein